VGYEYESYQASIRLAYPHDGMTRLEEVSAGALVRGITPHGLAKVVGVDWYGDQAIKVVYEEVDGTAKSRLLFRHDAADLLAPTEVHSTGRIEDDVVMGIAKLSDQVNGLVVTERWACSDRKTVTTPEQTSVAARNVLHLGLALGR
jgi:hypothetical protein